MEVDCCLAVLGIASTAGHALDLPNLAVEPLAHRIGHLMLIVGRDVIDVQANRLCGISNGLQPTVCHPEERGPILTQQAAI